MSGRQNKSIGEMLEVMTEWGEGVISVTNSSYRAIDGVVTKVGGEVGMRNSPDY